jgi:hypothetical protein
MARVKHPGLKGFLPPRRPPPPMRWSVSSGENVRWERSPREISYPAVIGSPRNGPVMEGRPPWKAVLRAGKVEVEGTMRVRGDERNYIYAWSLRVSTASPDRPEPWISFGRWYDVPRAALAPGKVVAFRFREALGLPPGRHQLQLCFHPILPGTDLGGDRFDAGFHMKKVPATRHWSQEIVVPPR